MWGIMQHILSIYITNSNAGKFSLRYAYSDEIEIFCIKLFACHERDYNREKIK